VTAPIAGTFHRQPLSPVWPGEKNEYNVEFCGCKGEITHIDLQEYHNLRVEPREGPSACVREFAQRGNKVVTIGEIRCYIRRDSGMPSPPGSEARKSGGPAHPACGKGGRETGMLGPKFPVPCTILRGIMTFPYVAITAVRNRAIALRRDAFCGNHGYAIIMSAPVSVR
jgi:hypothetical protein